MNNIAAALLVTMALTALSPALAVTEKQASAKDLFFRQLDDPKIAMNNGMQYWIELKRNGKITHVNSRFPFRSADEIRFHVTPNTDGFAYIILREGSSGNKSVLFPDPAHNDDQVVKAACEVAIPGDGFLEFDEVEGAEKLTILIARQRIAPEKYLQDTFKDKVVVASRVDGSKDLVPGSFVVAFANTSKPPETAAPTTSHPAPQVVAKVEPTAVLVPATVHTTATAPAPAAGKPDDDSVITIVQTQPANVLAVDVILSHGGRPR